jgi:hypothetical protein
VAPPGQRASRIQAITRRDRYRWPGFPADQWPQLPPDWPIEQNFTVTDAHKLPTSKNQCKSGGWRNYGIFKNQGDCVSFVATGGKNPPSGGR